MKRSKYLNVTVITLLIVMMSINLNAQWQKDSKYGFKINIPADWTKSSSMDGNDKVYDYYSADQNVAIQLRVFEAGEGVTTDMLAQIYEQHLLPEGTQKQSLENHTSKNGILGKQGAYILNYNGIEVTMGSFYTVQNNKGYVLTVMIPSNMREQKGQEIRQITQSFIIDGFEVTNDIVKEEKKPSGLGGLMGGTSKTNNQSKNNNFSGSTSSNSGNTQSTSSSENLVYQGQTYRTVKIGNQIWMAENLSVGIMLTKDKYPSDNGGIEKFCYEYEKINCDKMGGLYTWDEMMQYAESDYGDIGQTQGICPPGWHLPTDKEWMVLEGTVDSKYGIGDDIWYGWRRRGTDAAKKLKSKNGWLPTIRKLPPNGTDAFGFTVKPAGFKMSGEKGKFFKYNSICTLWTATKTSKKSDRVFFRHFSNGFDKAHRDAIAVNADNYNAYSVRCIKN